MSVLPKKNTLGFYEIRLESIGGLGANLAGKMLAEAGVLGLGLNGCNFSSYGSEKKGSPVKSFIRFCDPDVEIRDHSPIEHPHVIGVFHDGLYKMVDVAKGLQDEGILLINSVKQPAQIQQELQISGCTIAVIDALSIALEEKTKVNTAMLGALFRTCSFLNPEDMRKVIRQTFEKKYPHLVEPNIRTFDRGYNEVVFKHYHKETSEVLNIKTAAGHPQLGYQTQPIGGIITAYGNTILKDMSGSRQGFIPSFDQETCINCAACDNVCPDDCFVWIEGEDKRGRKNMFLQGIDYQFCKGCLKCVEACPTGSLTDLREIGNVATEKSVKKRIDSYKGGLVT
ncbi:2-oxoacid:acceptor oxidoreductase family protein [Bacillus testis]|uniref:2-oxoacid:acceptor oxidoreductase family protein n=1 Tax=Bacillus testis TaxID=1622072 RepID=UPI00067EBE0D|nr:2-oxoacid:acceptor oxidoreductase family protein [Bacillus testis]